MLSTLMSALRSRRPRPAGRQLTVESLEDRTVPSGGSGGGTNLLSNGTPGSGTEQVAVLSQNGGPGTSGGPGSSGTNSGGGGGISGPGYPLPPTGGPTRTTTDGGLTTTDVLVPLDGSPGGPSLLVGPVVTV